METMNYYNPRIDKLNVSLNNNSKWRELNRTTAFAVWEYWTINDVGG